jgi:hypothetical protein
MVGELLISQLKTYSSELPLPLESDHVAGTTWPLL